MKYDAVLILGRGIYVDGSLPLSAYPTIDKAVELYSTGQTKFVIFSGRWTYNLDYEPPKTEAAAMAEYARKIGLPNKAILLEEKSFTTVTNAYYLKTEYLLPNDWHSVALISVYPMAKRAHFVLQFVFGPEFHCDLIVADYKFPSDKITQKETTEKRKIVAAKLFYKLHHLVPGDHEEILRVTQVDLEKNWIK